jgi:hypothetical protein
MAETEKINGLTRKQPWDSRSTLLRNSVIAVVIMFLIFAGLLWKLGLFSFTDSNANIKIVAAALSLVGGLFGALVTLLGLVLKHSMDLRSHALQEQTEARLQVESVRNGQLAAEAEKRLTIESERNIQLAAEAESRLKDEVTIKAIELLSSSEGKDATDSQRAGVILTLAHLGKLALALSLADQMLTAAKLDSGTATWLFNEAMRAQDEDVRSQAVLLTGAHIEKMLSPNGQAVFPAYLLRDDFFSLPADVRDDAAQAIVDLILLRAFPQWASGVFFTLFDHLHHIWQHETAEDVRRIAGIALATFAQAYKPEQVINLSAKAQLVRELRAELAVYADQSLEGLMPNGTLRAICQADWVKALAEDKTRANEEHGVIPQAPAAQPAPQQ